MVERGCRGCPRPCIPRERHLAPAFCCLTCRTRPVRPTKQDDHSFTVVSVDQSQMNKHLFTPKTPRGLEPGGVKKVEEQGTLSSPCPSSTARVNIKSSGTAKKLI